MSHVQGHVEDPPKSPGKLRPYQGGAKCIDLIIRFPGDIKHYENGNGDLIEKGHVIGFHPYINERGEIWAKDIVKWSDHLKAEKAFMGNRLMEEIFFMFHDPAAIKKVKTQLSKGRSLDNQRKLTAPQIDVVEKTLAYMESDDFMTFYLSGGIVRGTDDVVEKIRELIIYPR